MTLSSDFRNFHMRAVALIRKTPTPNIAPIMSRVLPPPSSSLLSSPPAPVVNILSVELQTPASSQDVHARLTSLLQHRPFLHGALVQMLLMVHLAPGATIAVLVLVVVEVATVGEVVDVAVVVGGGVAMVVLALVLGMRYWHL